ncbi:MAG: DUF5020 family protein [Ignavibacteriales bacterium]
MKKLLLLAVFFTLVSSAFSQNLQLHYDMGKDRKYFTSTIEMFKPDEYGSTFFFVDMDYNRGGNKSVSLAYWEIARYVSLPFVKGLSATVQYNDGMIYNKDINMDFPLGHVWLAGLSYPINLGFVTLNTDFLYRADYLSESKANAQITTTWFVPFFEGKLTFTGFMDVWSTKQAGKNQVVLLTEPQLWYNVWNHLSVGSEVEISNNFIPLKNSVQVNPTIAAKWNF